MDDRPEILSIKQIIKNFKLLENKDKFCFKMVIKNMKKSSLKIKY